MRNLLFFSLLLISPLLFYSQSTYPESPYAASFRQAYQLYPSIPGGFLEAYAWHNTRMQVLDPVGPESCQGMPSARGIMGLYYNGKGYFRENGKEVAAISQIDTNQLFQNPHQEILAFAHYLQAQFWGLQESTEKLRKMAMLTEIPHDQSPANSFAREAILWEWIRFLNDKKAAANYNFTALGIDAVAFFGEENYALHSSSQIYISPQAVYNEQGDTLALPKSADYAPALWVPAASCNYGSRNGVAVSAVTIHTVQGTYAGCISWFQNCAASVSAHYVIRSSDGQITQMVSESDRAFHVGSENPYTIGFEHEGYVNNPAWYTQAMYQSSANLVQDIVASGYGISDLRVSWFPWAATTHYNASSIPGSCVRIKGHQHYPNQTHTDPGANWDWDYYFKLIDPTPPATVYTALSGTFTDSGNMGNYSNDERSIYRIEPPNASSVSVQFSSFSLENNWDYLYVYDGNSVFSPLLGVFTGNNLPPNLTANSGKMTFEFRSDCATTAPGWVVGWNSTLPTAPDTQAPITQISPWNNWITQDTQAQITDIDSGSGIAHCFYHAAYYKNNRWNAARDYGFVSDDFSVLTGDWVNYSGNWSSNGQWVEQSDEAISNSNLATALQQNNDSVFLYHFAASFDGTDANRRFGFHFMCDSVHKSNRGNSYFIWYRDMYQRLELYKVQNDVFTMIHDTGLVMHAGQWYDMKTYYHVQNGKIAVWVNDTLRLSYSDSNPHSIGNGVSFRSGNARMRVDFLESYKGRKKGSPIPISVGINKEWPACNPSPSLAGAQLKSIVIDSAGNPGYAMQYADVDFTAPHAPQNIADMQANDIDSISVYNGMYTAYWDAAVDSHSHVQYYYFGISQHPPGFDISLPNNPTFQLQASQNLSLQPYEWYYGGVFAQNFAGLNSDTLWSNGIIFIPSTGLFSEEKDGVEIYPNPSDDFVKIEGLESPSLLRIIDIKGQVLFEKTDYQNQEIDVPSAPGSYIIYYKNQTQEGVKKLIRH